MDNESQMKIDPHTYAESFITEDPFKTYARARGLKLVQAQVLEVCGY
jgi:hypothetical protein